MGQCSLACGRGHHSCCLFWLRARQLPLRARGSRPTAPPVPNQKLPRATTPSFLLAPTPTGRAITYELPCAPNKGWSQGA